MEKRNMTDIIGKSFIEEFKDRIRRLQSLLRENHTDALIVGTNANTYYLSGKVINGYIYVPLEGNPLFFVRRPKGLSGDGVFYIRKPEEIPGILKSSGMAVPERIALEWETMTHSSFVRLSSCFPETEMVDGSPFLKNCRAVKSPYEISLLYGSAAKHSRMYSHIRDVYRKGMTDVELSIGIEQVARSLGSLGIFRIAGPSMEIFMGSVLAGDNADAPSPYDFALGGAGQDPSLPVGADGTELKEGTTVMVDMGGNFTGYMTDMSRVFSIGEVRDTAALKGHRLSIDIQEALCERARPGIGAAELYAKARKMVEKENMASYFMGHSQQAGFIGHGVGIEINELPVLSPRSKDIIVEGMTFAMEPKFVIPGIGAVGTENTYVMRSSGLERMTDFDQDIQIL